jgi:hypothetical protein
MVYLRYTQYTLTDYLQQTLIWPSKWRLSKILFIASRYLPLAFVPIWVYCKCPRSCEGIVSMIVRQLRTRLDISERK